jgi:thiamine biosynthesis lipoprotein
MLKHNYSFEAIGTQWAIETNVEISSSLKTTIQYAIEQFDRTYSRFRKDSLVTRMSQKAGDYTLPENSKKLIDFYKKLYEITNGKVTPLIGDMIARAGYDADYSLMPETQKLIASWDEAIEWKYPVLCIKQPVVLDFGAAGKGYLVDLIAELLDSYSVKEYVVDASGDLRHKGLVENKVGLEHPLDTTRVIGAIDVQNKSFCASASNRRAWGSGMHHIFDPEKMEPTQEIIATWVVADDAMIADGIATALFFTEPVLLRNTFDFDFVRMYADQSVDYSSYFKEALF